MKNRKKLGQETGSMAVYVAIVLLAFLIILTGVYASSISVRKNQLITVLKIKESYEADNKDIQKIYEQQYNKLTK